MNDRFLSQLFLLDQLILFKVALIRQEFSTVKFYDSCGHPVQKKPIVGNGKDAALEVNQQVFEPNDGVDIEVVGGLIQQKNIRGSDQSLSKGHALRLSATQGVDHFIGVEFEPVDGFVHTLRPVPSVTQFNLVLQLIKITFSQRILINELNDIAQAFANGFKNSLTGDQNGLLSNVSQFKPLLHLHMPIVG